MHISFLLFLDPKFAKASKITSNIIVFNPNALNTATGEELFYFMIDLQRALFNITKFMTMYTIEYKHIDSFREECRTFLHEKLESYDKNVSLGTGSLLTNYFLSRRRRAIIYGYCVC